MTVDRELVVVGPSPLRGRLRVPGDKSISHRALLLAALAEGDSALEGLGTGDDVAATRMALGQLGVTSKTGRRGSVVISGRGAAGMVEPESVLDCRNSGTTMRLLLGILCGRPFHTVLTGDASLVKRPMRRVVEPLSAMGAHIDGRDGGEHAPLAVRGGRLAGTTHVLPVPSAQVKTALLLAGLQAEGATEICEPVPSRDHTERMLVALGVDLERVDASAVRVRSGAPRAFELEVPGDPSSAAFLVVAATLVAGSKLVVEGVALNPTRLEFVDVLRRMGASIVVSEREVRLGEPVGDLEVEHAPLRGTTIAGDEIPRVIDELPVLAVAAAFAEGTTEIRDAGELRVKESDRIAALERQLAVLGVAVTAQRDGLSVHGGGARPGRLESCGDHRLAMAAAVAALALEGTSRVRGWEAVASSYPGFAEDLATVCDGIEVSGIR